MGSELLEFLRTHDEAFRSASRLSSLYSDFREQRSTNPDGYSANSSAWLRALSLATEAAQIPSSSHDRYILNASEDLLRALQTQEYGRPLALGGVIDDAVRSGALVERKEFLRRNESLYKKSWVPSPWHIVDWGLKQIGMSGEGRAADESVRGQWVVVRNVEAAAKAVIEHVSKTATSNTSRVFSKDMFNSTFAPVLGASSLSQNDVEVLIKHLQRDRAVITYSSTSGVIKFQSPSEATPSPVTDEDVSIASLRALISSLEPQVEQLSTRISQLNITARVAVTNGQLPAAKTALRQKKNALTRLEQRTATLSHLEDVFAKIEQAADQVEMVKIMKASAQTLKHLNGQTGGVEKVQDIMDGLREEMLNVDEIGHAINEISAGEIDEGDVEDELEALEKKERQERQAREREEIERSEDVEAERTRLRLADLESVANKDVAEQKESEKAPDTLGS